MATLGRNDPCPCGSGLKFKRCCLGKPSDPLTGITPEMVAAYIDSRKQLLPPPVEDGSPLEVPAGFSAMKLFDDPTPNGVINRRVVQHFMQLSRYTDLNDTEGNQFIDILILVGRKMVSVWNHLANYRAEETRLVEGFQSGKMQHIDVSQTLFNEFDEFTVQIKSTLDHLVKIMIPMVGAKRWTIRTFGNKGEDVLTALKRNIGKGHEGRVRMMEVRLFEKHKAWLEAVIGARDRVNHYLDGGVDIKVFAVFKREDGVVEVPQWSREQKLAAMMDESWKILLNFVEDFVAMALNFRLPDDKYSLIWRSGMPAGSASSPWHLVRKELTDALLTNQNAKPI
jgi:hypothetical protein